MTNFVNKNTIKICAWFTTEIIELIPTAFNFYYSI